jgi:hypothetical protein
MTKLIGSLEEATRDHWDRATGEAMSRYKAAVRPLYSRRSDGRPEGAATSLLVTYKNKKLIVTAAHALDASPSLHLAAGAGLSPLNATFEATTLPATGRNHDHIDVAVAELSDTLVEALGDTPYIDLGTETASHFRPHDFFLVSGYRASQNKAPLANTTELTPTIWNYKAFGAPLPNSTQRQQAGIWNFAVDFDKTAKRANGEVVVNTPPKGVSGGAVFLLGNLADLDQIGSPIPHTPKLAGILIECPKGAGALVATHIDAIKAVLK